MSDDKQLSTDFLKSIEGKSMINTKILFVYSFLSDGKELKDVKAPAENIAGNIDMAMVSKRLNKIL